MSEQKHRVGVLISGSATTFETFCHNIAANGMPIEVPLLVADRASANLQVARDINDLLGWDIKPVLIDRETYPDGPTDRKWDLTDEQSEALFGEVREAEIEVVSQQGWLSRTRGVFWEAMGQQLEHTNVLQSSILNNHPGVTVDTPGLWGPKVHAEQRRLGRSGFTMHGVAGEYDTGRIWTKYRVPVYPEDTDKVLERRVQAVEKARTAVDVLAFARARVAYIQGELQPLV